MSGISKATISFNARPEVSVGGVKKPFEMMNVNGKSIVGVDLGNQTIARLKTMPGGKYDIELMRTGAKDLSNLNVKVNGGFVSRVRTSEGETIAGAPGAKGRGRSFMFDESFASGFVSAGRIVKPSRDKNMDASGLVGRRLAAVDGLNKRMENLKPGSKEHQQLKLERDGIQHELNRILDKQEGVSGTKPGGDTNVKRPGDQNTRLAGLAAKVMARVATLNKQMESLPKGSAEYKQLEQKRDTIQRRLHGILVKKQGDVRAQFGGKTAGGRSVHWTGLVAKRMDMIQTLNKRMAKLPKDSPEFQRLEKQRDLFQRTINRVLDRQQGIVHPPFGGKKGVELEGDTEPKVVISSSEPKPKPEGSPLKRAEVLSNGIEKLEQNVKKRRTEISEEIRNLSGYSDGGPPETLVLLSGISDYAKLYEKSLSSGDLANDELTQLRRTLESRFGKDVDKDFAKLHDAIADVVESETRIASSQEALMRL